MKEKKPNIIFFMLDSLRPDHLGCYSSKIAKTPNIDGLASDGIIFTNTYSEYPVTIPTRTALLAGIYTHTCRTWKPMTEYDLHIPKILKKRGYHTALFGDSPMTNEVYNCHEGFEVFENSPYGKIQFSVPGANKYLNKVNMSEYFWHDADYDADRMRGDYTLEIEQGLFRHSRANELYLREKFKVRRAEFLTNSVLDYLKGIKNKQNPFFLWIDYFEPHEPWLSDGEFLDPFKYLIDNSSEHCPLPPVYDKWLPEGVKKNLMAHVHATNYETDFEVGRVIQEIEKMGLTDETVFIVISDHGEPFGEHGTIRKYGVPIYDELAKIPFIVKGMNFNKKKTINTLLTTVDISQFILEIAGLKKVRTMESLPIFPVIEENNSKMDSIHDMIFMGAFQLRAGCRTPEWKFIDNRGEKGGIDELYNLKSDPKEKNNLIQEEPEIAEALCKDVWEFGKLWARQLAFRDHPIAPYARIKINKVMGLNFQEIN